MTNFSYTCMNPKLKFPLKVVSKNLLLILYEQKIMKKYRLILDKVLAADKRCYNQLLSQWSNNGRLLSERFDHA